ncbi:MAG TPA: hypothetical protein VFN61_01970 [Acidimicrobiales bacterium]|nr:hypothetical protein [Acidimicrobiales bacterium]
MPNYAQLDSDTVTNVVVAEADYAAEQGWVEVPADQPVGIGWTYDSTADTWTAPTPPTDPLAPARATVADLLAQQGALQSQLQADIAAVANWGTMPAAEQGAVMGRILQDGLGNTMQVIQALLQLTGNAAS